MVTVIVKVEPDDSVVHTVVSTETITDNGGTMLIAPEAAVAMEAELRSWMQSSPIKGELYIYDNTKRKYLRRMAPKRKANCLRFYGDLLVNDNSVGRRQILDELLEVRRLPPNYPIEKLRGQRGVFARTHISADTVLGLYSGIMLKDGCKEAKSRDLQSELIYLSGLDQSAFLTAEDLNNYAYNLQLCSQYEAQGGDDSLIVSALHRGNCLSLVNGFREEDGLPAERINATVVAVRMDDNVPVLLFVTMRRIAKDEEIIIDYGEAYFRRFDVEQMPINIDPADIADVSEVRPFNRFTRVANDAKADFVLHVTSMDERKSVVLQLYDVGIDITGVGNTLRIRSLEMVAAIEKQERVPAVEFPDDVIHLPVVVKVEANAPPRRRKRKATVEEVTADLIISSAKPSDAASNSSSSDGDLASSPEIDAVGYSESSIDANCGAFSTTKKCQAKRAKTSVKDSPKQSLQDLPLRCVEAICKLTPTSKLIRLFSTAVPLPGAFWNFGLEAVLKKRGPFSLEVAFKKLGPYSFWEDPGYHLADGPRTDPIFDSSGAKVATVKHPKEFQFSPLCEFVHSASVPFGRALTRAIGSHHRLYVTTGQPLLLHLRNVTKLRLIDQGDSWEPFTWKTVGDEDFLLPVLKRLAPQLESIAYLIRSEQHQPLEGSLVELLPEMAHLKRLDISPITLGTLMRAATSGSERAEAVYRSLRGLSTIRLRQSYSYCGGLPLEHLSLLSDCCTHLVHLTMKVQGDFKPYLTALRALVSLTTLGMELVFIDADRLTFDENEAVHSVSELRLIEEVSYGQKSKKHAIASLFPNVIVAALHYEAFAATKVWHKLDKLTYFDHYDTHNYPRFLANTNLPSSVDLSPIHNNILARDDKELTAIYKAMQSGPIKTLFLRGPVHREALWRLQIHVYRNHENVKITTRKDRDLGDQTDIIESFPVPATEFCPQSDVKIIGTKTSGILKGEEFMIRVVHQHSKRSDIFD